MEVIKQLTYKDTTLRIIKGDITESSVDAIVNAANSYLKHGGGVAAAIVRKGGKIIQEESDRIGYVPVGSCAITSAGNLKAKYVIHAVGPRWGEGDEHNKLRSAVRSALEMAEDRGLKSISMPAISAGIFGFPKDECAKIITEEIWNFVREKRVSLKEINVYLMDEEIINHFLSEFESLEKTLMGKKDG
ncbi:MAG: macro domain-containing protein [Desulfobacterota bacterium]|nr:macro domain-containing protein [Thermodesulfobacteriota bacterium]MDW8001822.1 macro domain-containing protein [Deltaproteobacteria bacterium]